MRRTPYPITLRPIFLEALSQCGCVTVAAAATNVSGASVYAWKAADPDFADAWEEALTLGLAGLEDRATELAMLGSEKLIMFLLQARKPEVYAAKQSVDVNLNHMNLRQPLDAMRQELAELLANPSRLPSEADPIITPISTRRATD